jgi:hypothetical protein
MIQSAFFFNAHVHVMSTLTLYTCIYIIFIKITISSRQSQILPCMLFVSLYHGHGHGHGHGKFIQALREIEVPAPSPSRLVPSPPRGEAYGTHPSETAFINSRTRVCVWMYVSVSILRVANMRACTTLKYNIYIYIHIYMHIYCSTF